MKNLFLVILLLFVSIDAFAQRRGYRRRGASGSSIYRGLEDPTCPIKSCKGKTKGEISCEDSMTMLFNYGSIFNKKREQEIIMGCRYVSRRNAYEPTKCVSKTMAVKDNVGTNWIQRLGTTKGGANFVEALKECITKFKKQWVK